MSKPERQQKVVLLGDASVGKSCIALRFSRDEFSDRLDPTLGAAFLTQTVDLGDSLVKLDIWDTAGQERYRSLAQIYYRGASAAVIVFDLTSRASFEGAKRWIPELKAQLENAVIALAGNKCDLPHREVERSVVEAFAEDNGMIYFETSAKTGENVRPLFEEVARRIPVAAPANQQQRGATNLSQQQDNGAIGGGCC